MPTKRKPIVRNLIEGISDVELFLVSDGLMGAQSEQKLWFFILTSNKEALLSLWNAHKSMILPEWIRRRPGTRPSLWWNFDAPRITPESITLMGRGAASVRCHPTEFCEPRARLGGIGTPDFQELNYGPNFELGIPTGWVDPWQVDYYNGRARDVHGDLIPCQWKEGDFVGVAIDPSNPPKFESQAAYLKRQNLLEPGEAQRLKAKDFEPETIEPGEEESTMPLSAGTVH
jgi:hypothetical protein